MRTTATSVPRHCELLNMRVYWNWWNKPCEAKQDAECLILGHCDPN